MRFDLGLLKHAITPVTLAVVSLMAAVALWIAVTNEENPTSDQETPFTIPIEPVGVPEGLAVLSMTPDAITVIVRVTDETFETLTASNFIATVDMTGIRETQSTRSIVVDVVGVDDDVDVVETTAQFTRVALETEQSKTVPVQVNRLGSLAQGFRITSTETSPEEVTVIGPSSSVVLVERADVDVNLTGVRSNIEIQGNLTPRDGGGAIQPRVRVDPPTAQVSVGVERQQTPQVVPVLTPTQGEVAAGYNLTGISVEPRTILVNGSLEVLQNLDSVETNPIDIGGASETIVRSVPIQLPEDVETETDTVTVTIQIEPATGSRAIIVVPDVTNLPSGLTAVVQTTSITVQISGEAPVINGLSGDDIQATVDLSGLEEGSHLVDVNVSVPEAVTLVSVEPARAVIALNP